MKFSSNAGAVAVAVAPALFLCLATTTTAFVPRPPVPDVPVTTKSKSNSSGSGSGSGSSKSNGKTALGYIKEGYDTGIGPDILRNKGAGRFPSPTDNEPEESDIIDAVVIEEDFGTDARPSAPSSTPTPTSTTSTTRREPFLDDKTGTFDNVVAVDDIVEKIKREMSSTSPSDVFPDPDEAAAAPTIWDTTTAKTIQGGALRTWSMEIPEIDHAQVLLKNPNGNPLHAQIDVWAGPGHSPMKLAVYCAHTSSTQPFSCVVPTPGYSAQSIGIKNSGPLEFPVQAVVIADIETARARRKQQQRESHQQQQQQQQHQQAYQPNQPYGSNTGSGYGGMYGSVDPNICSNRNTMHGGGNNHKPKPASGLGLFAESLRSLGDVRKINGAAPVDYASPGEVGSDTKNNNEELFDFETSVDSVQVLIETKGLSCQARIEVTYGGYDEIQQVIELQIEDGKERPFFAVIDTPLRCPSTVRVVNLDPYSAFPITACVEPYTIGSYGGNNGDASTVGSSSGDNNSNNNNNSNSNSNNNNHESFDFIDANFENVDTAAPRQQQQQNAEDEFAFVVPDVTIPATNTADYDFDEEFFFAN